MDAQLLKYCLLLSIFLLVACTARPAIPQADEPLLHFQKTPCLGTCPSYEATVFTSGRVHYQGYDHVPLRDTATFQLREKEFRELVNEIQALESLNLQETYLTQWSDMPATITRFYTKGKETKRVKHQEGGPTALLQFQEKLHARLLQLSEAHAHPRQ